MAGVVKVVRVVRVRVILSEILKWQRFLEVISRFLEVISTKGRYRAARAAKNKTINRFSCLIQSHKLYKYP